jgi:hypothetical protein
MASPSNPTLPPPSPLLIQHTPTRHYLPRLSTCGYLEASIASSASLHTHPDDQSYPSHASAPSATNLHHSDTRVAPESSQLPQIPSNPPLSSNSHNNIIKDQRIAPLKVRDRSLSTVSTTSTTSSVKRKALPTNISPLALRYSTGEYLSSTLEEPDAPFNRTYSDDSPTIYQFPATASAQAFTPDLSRNSSQRYAFIFS